MDFVSPQRRFLNAIVKGDLAVVQRLIGSDGVDVDEVNRSLGGFLGLKPLGVAVKQDFPLIAAELLHAKANANARDTYSGESLLHIAVRNILELKERSRLAQSMQLIELLLSNGADFSVIANNHTSIFHLCATHYAHSKHVPLPSPICGKELCKQLVRSVCITQGALLEVAVEKEQTENTAKLPHVLRGLKDVFQQKGGLMAESVTEIFCEKTHECRLGWHPTYCAAHITLLDQAFVERLKKEAIE